MKPRYLAITLALATALSAGRSALADPTEKTVAFRTTIGSPRYVTATAKGGLNTKNKEIKGNSTFVLIDLNGGELADGDTVNIRWVPSSAKPTYWYETEGKVRRIGGKASASCNFTVKLRAVTVKDTPRVLTLQTASGKWVSEPEKGVNAISTTEKPDDALSLELVENPAPKATEKDEEDKE